MDEQVSDSTGQNLPAVRDQARGDIVRHDGMGGTALERAAETSAAAVAERAKAEVQARYLVAIQSPRNIDDARVRILTHCKRLRFADAARYKKPIGGGKHIEGASIRFVEAALQAWGNVYADTTVAYEDDEKRIVKVTLTDFEGNITYSKDVVVEKSVERHSVVGREVIGSRRNSRGETVYTVRATSAELAQVQGAAESKAIRTLGLRILPADIVDEAMDQCVRVVASAVDADPDRARKELADAFTAIGVSPKELAKFLGHELSAAAPPQLLELRAIYQAIRDGEATWKDAVAYKAIDEAGPDDKKPRATKGVAAVKGRIQERRSQANRSKVIDVDAGDQ